MRRLVLSLLVAFMVVSPAAAQVATPEPVPIGTVEKASVTYQRLALIGMIVFRATVSIVDGSVPDPVDVYMDAVMAEYPSLVEASPPKHGEYARMLHGTIDEDGQAIETAIVAIQDGDYVFALLGGGLALVLPDFLPLVDTLMQRPFDTLDGWLPTLADMPAGFTVSE